MMNQTAISFALLCMALCSCVAPLEPGEDNNQLFGDDDDSSSGDDDDTVVTDDDDDSSGDDDDSSGDDDDTSGDDDDDTAGDDDDTAGDDDDTAGDDDDTAGDDDDISGDDDDSTGSGTETIDPAIPAPSITGELSAGHDSPTWFWTGPSLATIYRWRLNGGPWQSAPLSISSYQSNGLSIGAHTFEVATGIGNDTWSPAAAFTTTVEYFVSNGAVWEGVERALPVTAEGSVTAVNCHNCYADSSSSSPSSNLSQGLSTIDAAVVANADLIELDLHVQGGTWYVAHDWSFNFSSFAPLLASYLSSSGLQNINQPLFMELKTADPSEAELRDLLTLLADADYATNGRPVWFRAFHDKDSLDTLDVILADTTFLPHNRHYFRLSDLFRHSAFSSFASNGNGGDGGMDALIAQSLADGRNMVEFSVADNYTRNLVGRMAYAKALGLGVGVWTVPGDNFSNVGWGDMYCAALRNEVDAMTSDWDLGDCRAHIVTGSTLVYFNSHDLNVSGSGATTALPYFTSGGTNDSILVNTAGRPDLIDAGANQDFSGTMLQFDGTELLDLGDHDNGPTAGVLVAINANFDGLSSMSNGDVASLVTKAEGSGWYLEIEQRGGDPELSFGVHVGGSYHAATWDGGGVLNETSAFWIVGCYDGNGGVRLLVNGELVASSSSMLSGGVSTNASPIVVGANWQSGGSYIRFMEFQVQSLMVQEWIE